MGCPLSTQRSIEHCMYEKKPPEARKENQLKELEGIVPAAHMGPGTVPGSSSHTRKTHN